MNTVQNTLTLHKASIELYTNIETQKHWLSLLNELHGNILND